MRRLLIAGFASLLAVALIAPAAQGATGVRSLTLEGQFGGGGVPTPYQVQLSIDYLVKHKNGHKRLIPNRVTHFEYAFPEPVSCDQGSTFVGDGFGPDPLNIEITKKRFSSTYTTTGPVVQSTVKLVGQRMWQERTKWRSPDKKPKPAGRKFFWKRASGVLSIIDFEEPELGFTNCSSNGPASWSAHQCRDGSGPVYVPVCQAFGSGRTADPAASRFRGR